MGLLLMSGILEFVSAHQSFATLTPASSSGSPSQITPLPIEQPLTRSQAEQELERLKNSYPIAPLYKKKDTQCQIKPAEGTFQKFGRKVGKIFASLNFVAKKRKAKEQKKQEKIAWQKHLQDYGNWLQAESRHKQAIRAFEDKHFPEIKQRILEEQIKQRELLIAQEMKEKEQKEKKIEAERIRLEKLWEENPHRAWLEEKAKKDEEYRLRKLEEQEEMDRLMKQPGYYWGTYMSYYC